MKKILLTLLSLSLLACAPKVRTQITKSYLPLENTQPVTVVQLTEPLPASAIEIGTVKVGDNGMTENCTWEVVVELAKQEARKAGGNLLQITEHTLPGAYGSPCHQIKAKIFRAENSQELESITSRQTPVADSTWNYARLYVYRPSGAGFLIGYNIHLGDSVICRMENKSKSKIIITKKGNNRLWAKTESTSEVPINFEWGKEYYLRCTIGMGLLVGRPKLQLVDNATGKKEYDAIK